MKKFKMLENRKGRHKKIVVVFSIFVLCGIVGTSINEPQTNFIDNVESNLFIHSSPCSPFNITMSVNGTPSLNETFTVVSKVNSSINVTEAEILINISSGIEYVEGDLMWNGSLYENEIFVLNTTVNLTEIGDWTISINLTMGDFQQSRYLFFCVNETNTSFDYAPRYNDNLSTQELDLIILNESMDPVTISGRWYYKNEDETQNIKIRYAIVELWRNTWPFPTREQMTYTDGDGYYQFNPESAGELKVKVLTESHSASGYDVAHVRTSGLFPKTYVWATDWLDINDDVYLSRTCIGINRVVWYVYHNMVDEYVWLKNEVGWSRSEIDVYCFEGSNSGFHFPGDYITIASQHGWGDWARTVHLHEYAHAIMWSAYGYFPSGGGPSPHYPDSESSSGFAIIEGWAEFMPCVVENDPGKMGGWGNLEDGHSSGVVWADSTQHGGDYGDWDGNKVEGAVASMLWDIYDGSDSNDYPNYYSFSDYGDYISNNFDRIWTIIKNDNPNGMDADFWLDWQMRYGLDANIWAIYYNMRIRIDTLDPSNPTSYSSSHTVGTWSNDDTIYVEWYGASDILSGVYGYGTGWSPYPFDPGEYLDTTNNYITSGSLID